MTTYARLVILVVAALLLITPSLALAQASAQSAPIPPAQMVTNFYAAVRGALNFTSDTKQGEPGHEDTFTFHPGFIGGMALGYRLPFNFRVEGEGSFLWAPVKTDRGIEVDGSVKSWLIFANAYYDLKLPFLGPFTPYIGFGIGGAYINEDHQVLLGPQALKVDVDDWRTSFAYQARVGVTYTFNEWLDLMAGYRFVHINGGTPTMHGQPVSFFGMNNHAAEVGFAVKF